MKLNYIFSTVIILVGSLYLLSNHRVTVSPVFCETSSVKYFCKALHIVISLLVISF